jgi:hypothetical protein
MFDDGQHNDGSPGDNIYGAAFTVDGTQPEFYVYAENLNAGKFSPARAEHEFYTVTLASQPLTTGTVVINEVLTGNSIQEDEYGESNEWVELYNTSNSVINLSGSHLSDTVTDPTRWTFREGTLIAPGAYLIVWADDDEEQWFHHSNFNLASTGETLLLSDADGNVIDQISYPIQTQDISFGRYPNGTGPWNFMETTINAANSMPLTIADTRGLVSGIVARPNPTVSTLTVESHKSTLRSLTIYDLTGKQVGYEICTHSSKQVDLEHLTAGIYLLQVIIEDGHTETIRIVKE